MHRPDNEHTEMLNQLHVQPLKMTREEFSRAWPEHELLMGHRHEDYCEVSIDSVFFNRSFYVFDASTPEICVTKRYATFARVYKLDEHVVWVPASGSGIEGAFFRFEASSYEQLLGASVQTLPETSMDAIHSELRASLVNMIEKTRMSPQVFPCSTFDSTGKAVSELLHESKLDSSFAVWWMKPMRVELAILDSSLDMLIVREGGQLAVRPFSQHAFSLPKLWPAGAFHAVLTSPQLSIALERYVKESRNNSETSGGLTGPFDIEFFCQLEKLRMAKEA